MHQAHLTTMRRSATADQPLRRDPVVGAAERHRVTRPSGGRRPATLQMLVTSMASSSVSGGGSVASRRARSVSPGARGADQHSVVDDFGRPSETRYTLLVNRT